MRQLKIEGSVEQVEEVIFKDTIKVFRNKGNNLPDSYGNSVGHMWR